MRIDNTKDLGVYVRERRRTLGLTQVQLARRALVSRRWLIDLEAGKIADIELVLRTLRTLDVVLDARSAEPRREGRRPTPAPAADLHRRRETVTAVAVDSSGGP